MAEGNSVQKSYRTPRGLIHVSTYCSPEFIESLEIDDGFGAIVPPGRLRPLLWGIAEKPDGNVILAFLDSYRLVGFLMVAKPEPVTWQGKTYHRRWEKSKVIYELGSIEVSKNFRELGIAGKMLGMLSTDYIEDRIVIAIELSWHWDYADTSMDKWQYRNMMVDLFSAAGFVEMQTDDPEITYDTANTFMARIGSRVSPKDVSLFHSLLFERGD